MECLHKPCSHDSYTHFLLKHVFHIPALGYNRPEVKIGDMVVTRIKKATEATVTSMGKGPETFPYIAPEMFRKARRGTAVDILWLYTSRAL